MTSNSPDTERSGRSEDSGGSPGGLRVAVPLSLLSDGEPIEQHGQARQDARKVAAVNQADAAGFPGENFSTRSFWKLMVSSPISLANFGM